MADADRPALRALFLQARRAAFHWLAANDFQAGDFDEQTRGERILVAEDDTGTVAGFIAVWEPDSFVHHLYVATDRQRQGIGQALLRAAGWPGQTLRLKCLVRNEAALSFYRALGFVETDRGVAEDGDYLVFESRLT